jgi:hypothetical protein
MFRNYVSFYGEELLAPRPNPKLEDYPFTAVRDCLLNIFAATLHIGCHSSICNLSTRHAVVIGAHTFGVQKMLKLDVMIRALQKNRYCLYISFALIL